jgi:hypothetical protein
MRKKENKCLYWKVKNTSFFFVTNKTDLSSEEVDLFYTKCAGSAKNAEMPKITSKKPSDMAVGHLLLQSFWVNTLKNRAQ